MTLQILNTTTALSPTNGAMEQKQLSYPAKPVGPDQFPSCQYNTGLAMAMTMVPTQPTMRYPDYYQPSSPQAAGGARIATMETRDPNPALPETEEDIKSEVSSLRCGSVPPNPRYDPAHDPFLTNRPFVPPEEIEVRVKTPLRQTQPQEQSEETPEWLQLSENKKDPKSKHRRFPRLRRSRSLSSAKVSQTQKQQVPGSPPAHLDLRRSSSNEEPPHATPVSHTRSGTNHTPLSSSSSALFFNSNKLVLGNSGPLFCADGTEEQADSTEKELSCFADFVGEYPLDCKQLVVTTAGSFADSFNTIPTAAYESSSSEPPNDAGVVAVVALPLREQLEEIPEQALSTPKKKQPQPQLPQSQPQQQRKGMVRREFQRRLMWFKRNKKDGAGNKSSSNNESKNIKKQKQKKTQQLCTTSKRNNEEWHQACGSMV
eukprot:CAMPEP_0178757560 /NCGR_PEP_ID=MMETSP0744-20121128/13888_1 /TAXON_ID=913974 /ORGANISM="Nitzschia punctata, Strain CCMP561" /LENGTH=428 /DNA_ID=CAMNT_0020411807 /DNA_START=325 /DNA_END=1611 /DNA_ORIENTATION=-